MQKFKHNLVKQEVDTPQTQCNSSYLFVKYNLRYLEHFPDVRMDKG
jgi:hypothetical protein